MFTALEAGRAKKKNDFDPLHLSNVSVFSRDGSHFYFSNENLTVSRCFFYERKYFDRKIYLVSDKYLAFLPFKPAAEDGE
jgi:hypothetical protein